MSGTMTQGPVNGPCTAWCDAQDIIDCGGSETSDTSLLTLAAEAASDVLFQLSARQFVGECSQTVRPCADGCGCWPYQFMPGLSVGAPQVPFGWSGGWGFWGWGWGWGSADNCGCSPLSRALLPGYPVTEITEVKIDGVVIDASEYRLNGWRWLTRMADADGNAQFWPGCQRLDLPDTEEGTWSATYNYGVAPPEMGIRAAAQLGKEILAACGGNECALPVGAVQVTRAGITVQKAPFLSWAQINGRWATGLPLVDLFLSSVNKKGITRRPISWAPGSPEYAKRVGT